MPKYKYTKQLFLLALLLSFPILGIAQVATNYHRYFATAQYNGSTIIILRKFEQGNRPYYLYVDPNTIETTTIDAVKVTAQPVKWDDVLALTKTHLILRHYLQHNNNLSRCRMPGLPMPILKKRALP